MTDLRKIRGLSDGLLALLGIGLIASPWLMGPVAEGIQQIIINWTAWVAGGIAVAVAIYSFNGHHRDAAGWSVAGGVILLAGLLVPGVMAVDLLVWAKVGVALYMIVTGALFLRTGRDDDAVA